MNQDQDRPEPETTEIQAPPTTAPDIPVDLSLLPLDAQLDALRGVYAVGINEIMDAVLVRMALPQNQEALLKDAAAYMLFLFTVKATAFHGEDPKLPILMKQFRVFLKHIEKEVPSGLVDFVSELRKEQRDH